MDGRIGALTIGGAPAGAGAFTGGSDARVSERVAVGIAADGTLSEHYREGRVNLSLRIGF